MGSSPKVPPPQASAPPPPLPIDPAVLETRRKLRRSAAGATGMPSTILTGPRGVQTLGGRTKPTLVTSNRPAVGGY